MSNFILSNDVLGTAFIVIAAIMTLAMFKAWGYPYDKAAHRSSAPRSLVWGHRLLGYLYVAIYIYLMWQMVPRLWTYQVELPARTVAHLLLGMSIAALLLVKLTIVRFFKHMEASLVPMLGTALFICSFLLVSLALPVKVRETFLRDEALMGGSFTEERLTRVRTQLPKAGLDDPAALEQLATTESLLAGREVLRAKCVQCHDLRTVLARPRTPEAWRRTIARMAERSTALNVISDDEQWQVTAYLIAISPALQESLKQRRAMDSVDAEAHKSASKARKLVESEGADEAFDVSAARGLFEVKCSQCHAYQQIEAAQLAAPQDVTDLVMRMVSNGLAATDTELESIIRFIAQSYVEADAAPAVEEDAPADEDETQARSAAAQVSDDGSAVIVVRPLGEDLQFEHDVLTVSSGARLRIEFDNTSGQLHNFALLERGADADTVINASFDASADGYLPAGVALLAGIPATEPGARAAVGLLAPAAGEYEFLCLMPGHSYTMRGILRVTE